LTVPRQWTVTAARGTAATPIEKDDWWSSFQDPELNSLVERSAKQNLDLKLALERVQEARAARGVARSGYFPYIDGAGSATRNRQKNHRASRAARNLPSSSQSNITIFRAALPLMGIGCLRGIRRSVQAANCRHDRCGRESPRPCSSFCWAMSARVYAQLRGFQRRLEIANKNIKTQQEDS